MEKSFLLRGTCFTLLLCLLCFPFMVLVRQVPWEWPAWDDSLPMVLKGAFLQSVLSTALTIVFGVLGLVGLLSIMHRLTQRMRGLVQFLLIFPSFLPPILVVVLSIQTLSFLPTGLWGVVFFHVLMNAGLVSLLLYLRMENKAGLWVMWGQVAGISPVQLFSRIVFYELRSELLALSFYLFVLFFLSFSIPFLVGGSAYGGVEVLIYEKVILFGQWGQALQYSLVLFIFVLLISSLLPEEETTPTRLSSTGSQPLSYMSAPFFVFFSFLSVSFILFSFVLAVPLGLEIFSFTAIRGTLILGFVVGLLTLLFLCLLSWSFIRGRASWFLAAFVHPGWVVVGFSFLLIGGRGAFFDLFKTSLALTLIYLPFLYRLSFKRNLESLQNQVQVTETFPTPWGKTFRQVLFPQLLPHLTLLSGLAGLWACGDFAMTGLLFQDPQLSTLGLEMKELLSNYRDEQALQLLWPLVISGTIVFVTFQGLTYVSRQKAF
jgi:thiamine transport system permease protein